MNTTSSKSWRLILFLTLSVGLFLSASFQRNDVTSPPPARIRLTTDEYVRLLRAYKKLPDNLPHASFDVKAKAAGLGKTVEAAFSFVRDGIANEVYPGVLRGPEGTLSAAAGNSLDKSQLLGALLAAQKLKVRYAQGSLDKERALAIIRSMFARPAPPDQVDLDQALKAAMIQAGIPEARSAELLQARRANFADLEKLVQTTSEADTALVRKALEGAGVRPSPNAVQASLLSEAQTHYWVQVEQEGRWLDLDPSFSEAQPGKAFCAAAQTFPELPAGVSQYVTFRVRNEYLEGGKLRRENVLEQKLTTPSLHGKPIQFMNLPAIPEGPLGGGISSVKTFTPYLIVGESVWAGKEFKIAKEQAGGAAGLFGEALGGGEEEDTPLLAQWLELEMTAPGRKSIVTRPILDAVDPGERASESITTVPDVNFVAAQLVHTHAMAVSTGNLNPLQIIAASCANLDPDAAGRVFDGVANAENRSDQSFVDFAAVEGNILESLAMGYARFSDRALRGLSTAGGPKVRAYRDQPSIVIADIGLRRSTDGERVFLGLSLDVRHNEVRVVPESLEANDQAFWLSVRQGLIDGAIERHLIPSLAVGNSDSQSPRPPLTLFSTSTALELARAQGLKVWAARGAAAAQLLRERFAVAGGRRLAREVNEDTGIILPSNPIKFQDEDRLGLWTVDLRSGHVVALLDTGLRQDTIETLLNKMVESKNAYLRCVQAGGAHYMCDALLQILIQNIRKLTVRMAVEFVTGGFDKLPPVLPF